MPGCFLDKSGIISVFACGKVLLSRAQPAFFIFYFCCSAPCVWKGDHARFCLATKHPAGYARSYIYEVWKVPDFVHAYTPVCAKRSGFLMYLLLLLLLFPHISPISRTRGHRHRLPFPYHRYIKKKKKKERKRGKKNNRRESLPRSDRRGGGKIKQEQKNRSKDPPSISERQINKQARQTKCQDHTTVDTVRESLSTPHPSLGGEQRTVER